MTAPSEEIDLAEIERQRGLRILGRSMASRIAHEHPTLVFTLVYFALTAVGLIYDLWFFFYFKINILDYSETGYFLLAAIRNPMVIILSLLPAGLLFIALHLRQLAIRKSARYDAYRKKYINTIWNSRGLKLTGSVLFIAMYATVFTQIYAQISADGVKRGVGQRVMVTRNNGVTSAEKPILLGTTTRFFFLYYLSRKETEIVPVDNVSLVTVDSRTRRELEKDSLASLGTRVEAEPDRALA